MHIKVEQIGEVTLQGREVEQLWRMLKNECEGADTAEATTYGMYLALRRWLDEGIK